MWFAVVTYSFDQDGDPILQAAYTGFWSRVAAWEWAHEHGLVDMPDEPGKWEDIKFSFDIVPEITAG